LGGYEKEFLEKVANEEEVDDRTQSNTHHQLEARISD